MKAEVCMENKFMPEEGIAGKYVSTVKTPEGYLSAIKFHNDDHFNFAYDVVDVLAEKCPDKTAMLHISRDGKERRFTFQDMMLYTNRTANYFSYIGIKKGDRVMLVLKRHYQFWFAILALHKIGAVAVPATYLLTRKDFEYRFKAGHIDAVAQQQTHQRPIADAHTQHQGPLALPLFKVLIQSCHFIHLLSEIRFFSFRFALFSSPFPPSSGNQR